MVVNNNPDLTNNYAGLESFRANKPVAQPAGNTKTEQAPDRVEISEDSKVSAPRNETVADKPKKRKRGVIQGFKNIIANIKKFGIATAEYTVATAKGLVYGAIAAAGVLGIDAGVGAYKIIKNAKKATVSETAEKAGKILSKKGKFGAALAGVLVMGYHWFNASLNTSQRGAAVDHRWGSGHDEVIK